MPHQVDCAVPRGGVASRRFARLLAAVAGAACAAALLAAAPAAATAAPAEPRTGASAPAPHARTASDVEAPAIEDAVLTRPGARFVPDGPTRVMPARRVAERSATVLTLAGVPAGATAVALNVTAARATAATWVSVCPGGTPVASCRTTSTLNVTAGRDVANHVVVRLGGPDGNQVLLWNQAGGIDLIADLQGWYVPEGATLQPAGPTRVMSARPVTGGAATVLTLSGVPAGATAVALNVTAARATAATWISVCPGGTPLSTCRTTSTLNVTAGHDVANHVVVRLGGPDGDQVVLRNQAGTAALIADLQGWYVPDGSSLQPTDPTRVMSARPVPGGTATVLTLADVPAGATAVALNVTAARATAGTWVSACPGGTPVATCRTTSSLNVTARQDVANHVVVRLGGPARDQVVLYNQAGTADVIADLQGWYRESETTTVGVGGDRLRIAPRGGTVEVTVPYDVLGPVVTLHVDVPGALASSTVPVVGPGLFGQLAVDGNVVYLRPVQVGDHVLTFSTTPGESFVLTASASRAVAPAPSGWTVVDSERPGELLTIELGDLAGGDRFDVLVEGPVLASAVRDVWGHTLERRSRGSGQGPVYTAESSMRHRLEAVSAGAAFLVQPLLPHRLAAVVGGPAVTVPGSAATQNAVIDLGDLAAGARLEVGAEFSTSGESTHVELLDRHGAVAARSQLPAATFAIGRAGGYRLRVFNASSMVLVVALARVEPALAADAPTREVAAVDPGRTVRIPLTRATGPGLVGIHLDRSSHDLRAVVLGPDGSVLGALQGGEAALSTVVPATGAYLELSPWGTTTVGPIRVTATTPVRVSAEVDGGPAPMPPTRPGQPVQVLLTPERDGRVDVVADAPGEAHLADGTRVASFWAQQVSSPWLRAGTTVTYTLHDPLGRGVAPFLLASTPVRVAASGPQVDLDVPSTRPGQTVEVEISGLDPSTRFQLVGTTPDAWGLTVDWTDEQGRMLPHSPTAGGTSFGAVLWERDVSTGLLRLIPGGTTPLGPLHLELRPLEE